MPPLITAAIAPRAFEQIRQGLLVILAAELGNQFALTTEDVLNVKVIDELKTPIDITEPPALTVNLVEGNYTNKTTGTGETDGEYNYHIDCYVGAKQDPTTLGGSKAASDLQRLLGVVHAIITDPRYKRLGFDQVPGATNFIERQLITALEISQHQQKLDDDSWILQGRLTLEVRATERINLVDALPLLLSAFTVDVEDTGKLLQYNWPGQTLP